MSEPGDEEASQQAVGSTQGSIYEEPRPYIPQPCTRSVLQWIDIVGSSNGQSSFCQGGRTRIQMKRHLGLAVEGHLNTCSNGNIPSTSQNAVKNF